ncbi:hypothetical protein PK35_gp75 [Geobacillus phage vB_GthS_PK3.5]|nr:hypothetical protein PK35_gp75 [Geobacillus phage vB_GthS_PK3.5]UYL94050.1 hypothetical protein PK36_gp67 [Geobacillus phage vB_GthS_PK3.6]
MYYGLNVDDKKKVVYELLGIVPLTDEIRKLILKSDNLAILAVQKFDYVRYDGKRFSYYSKEYLETVDLDEFIEKVAGMIE